MKTLSRASRNFAETVAFPQEPKGPLIKHGQVARHDAAQFLSMLAKETGRELLAQLHWTFLFLSPT
jgi:hypothetical protein